MKQGRSIILSVIFGIMLAFAFVAGGMWIGIMVDNATQDYQRGKHPEGKVKKMVRAVLEEFTEQKNVDGYYVATLKQYWPVPSGFGSSDLDCVVCYYGRYIAIETKAPKKVPTPRQQLTIAETKAAGGMVFVIKDEIGCHELRVTLQGIKDANNR